MTNYTFDEFKEKTGLGTCGIARLCGIEVQQLSRIKNRTIAPHVIRFDEETGDVAVIKLEKTVCSGNLNKRR